MKAGESDQVRFYIRAPKFNRSSNYNGARGAAFALVIASPSLFYHFPGRPLFTRRLLRVPGKYEALTFPFEN